MQQNGDVENFSEHAIHLLDEQATVALGRCLGAAMVGGERIFLRGTLGAGKTTLTRGLLSAFGYSGAVKSPTYTLVEPYELAEQRIYHFDLYRLADPEELEYLGARDYFDSDGICIIEWPQRGEGFLPQPDLNIAMEVEGLHRRARLRAGSPVGQKLIDSLTDANTRQP